MRNVQQSALIFFYEAGINLNVYSLHEIIPRDRDSELLKEGCSTSFFRQLAENNLDATFYEALASVMPKKMYGFYRSMPYFQF